MRQKMNARLILLFGMILLLAPLSGCVGDGGAEVVTTTSSTSSTTTSTTTTTTTTTSTTTTTTTTTTTSTTTTTLDPIRASCGKQTCLAEDFHGECKRWMNITKVCADPYHVLDCDTGDIITCEFKKCMSDRYGYGSCIGERINR